MSKLPKNTTALTAEYCHRINERLVFEPQTMHEAAFIARELQGMGFKYYHQEYAGQLDKTLTGCLYLDTDNTIMVSEGKREDGLLCTVDEFENFYIPENMIEMESRLTDQDIATRTLAFFPRTGAEARGTFGALVQRGAVTEVPEKNASVLIAMAVTQGMIVQNGVMHFAPRKEDLIGAEICTAADLGFNSASALSVEQMTIMAAFNEMAARMEQMAARIAKLEGEILPQKIEKRKPVTPVLNLKK